MDKIIRVWDDEDLYAEIRRRCCERVEMWRRKVLLPRYDEVCENLFAGRQTRA